MIDRSVEHFAISSDLVEASGELRLDASFYNRRVIQARAALDRCGMMIKTLGELTNAVFFPTRFKRIYVTADHGVPFLQGSHVVQFQPTDVKYLSRKVHKNMDALLIRAGWLLITRSGTVGRVTVVPPEWDGWAASEHVFRVIPKVGSECPPGYLAAFLSSPLGQAQLTAQIYGAVVDELTEEHVRSVRVPIPTTPEQRQEVMAVDQLAKKSVRQRAAAVKLANQAAARLDEFLPTSDVPDECDHERRLTGSSD
jgi:Type I restriction modification DNA specificity domain